MKLKSVISTLALTTLASPLFAATVDFKLTNLTNGQYFTPVLFAAHDDSIALFKVGDKASDALQKMAEGGNTADLKTVADTAGAVTAVLGDGVDADGKPKPIGPGQSAMATAWDTAANGYLSITGMLLPTNDGFVGLNSWKIPSEAGTYTIYLNGYDAGTEANDEKSVPGAAGGAPGNQGIPAFPGGGAGAGGSGVTDAAATADENTNIHVHRGVLGDLDPAGGKSDLNSAVHRWLNPVAKIVVTVK